MIEVTITDEMRRSAQKSAEEMGVLPSSILKGGGNYVGFLGEEAALKVLKAKRENTLDYDMLVGRKKIDVKSQAVKYKPKQDYYCAVAKTSLHQKCDYYCFMKVDIERNKAYYMGVISKKNFMQKALHVAAGKRPPKLNTSKRFTTDAYVIRGTELQEGFRNVPI
jgi:hypothetical protein